MLRSDWENELARSGLSPVRPKEAKTQGGVTCPACGTTAPLVDGECSDCGLALG
ncbi:MAG: hypothetical protein MUC50_07165 [Myxococcota bacterium]|nr:hypothetical protein [Myxococcota bacterium]